MTDDLARRFAALDAPRALPADLRGRIERRLLEPDLVDALAAVDAPRAIPDALRGRLEAALIPDRVEALSLPLRRRLRRSLLARSPWVRAGAGVAAALLVLTGSVAVVSRDSPRGGHLDSGQKNNDALSAGGAAGLDSGAGDAATGGAGSGGSAATAGGGDAGVASGTASAAFGAQPLAIAVIGGDQGAEAGFRAYLDQSNSTGGAGGHRLAMVDEKEAAVVTVNLADLPSSSERRPLLEALSVPESKLSGDVFAVASVAERQAHIAADAAFPTTARGVRAVIFTDGDEPFASRVPAAIEQVLRSRGVSAIRVPYDGGSAPLLPPAAAAFLSLPTESARSWLRAASGYAPERGVWGVYSLADESLLADMTAQTHIVSPFAFDGTDQSAVLRAVSGVALSARSVQGWLTARYIAEAITRTGADTATELAAALRRMQGFVDGFGAPYGVRPSTNSRTPEGIILRPRGATFVAEGTFVTDDS